MACCNGQTNCERVVTIEYINSIIGNSIQNASGASVSASTISGGTYCPTYAQLTGGTFIPYYSWQNTPYNDVDGICIYNNSYMENQLVRREDLGLRYSRYDHSIVTPNNININNCGGNTTITRDDYYVRYERFIASDCEFPPPSSPSNEEYVNVIDDRVSDYTWSGVTTPFGSITKRSVNYKDKYDVDSNTSSDTRNCTWKYFIKYRTSNMTSKAVSFNVSQDPCCVSEYSIFSVSGLSKTVERCGDSGELSELTAQTKCTTATTWEAAQISINVTKVSGEDFINIFLNDSGTNINFKTTSINCDNENSRTAVYDIEVTVVGSSPTVVRTCRVTFTQPSGLVPNKCSDCPCECEDINIII